MDLHAAFSLLAAVALWTLPAATAIAQDRVAPVTSIYIARGATDACGAGCDRWIAVEGMIDLAAAERLRSVFESPQAFGLPVYLHSSGGNVRQSTDMGRLLRERRATARVARTLVKQCGADQASTECVKLKQAGGELHAELTTSRAQCSSGCAFVLMGAVRREVPVDAPLGVHSVRILRGGAGRQELSLTGLDQSNAHAVEIVNSELLGFFIAMGIDRELLNLIKSVPNESIHMLTRDELFRFGIDRRDQVETDWTFAGSWIEKLVESRGIAGASEFRMRRWRFECGNEQDVVLSYARNVRDEPLASVVLRFGADQEIAFGAMDRAELRSVKIRADAIEKLRVASRLSLTEVGVTDAATGVRPPVRETVLSTTGLAQSIEQLSRGCVRYGKRG